MSKTANGYEWDHKGSQVQLYKKQVKRSQLWFMDYKGTTYAMPRKASFNHAEALLATL